MAIKVAEGQALRRAFDVSAPTVEERWDVELPAEPPAPKPTLAERAAQRAAEVAEPLVLEPMTPETSAAAEPGLPWTRERLHDAAKRAGLVKLAGQASRGRPRRPAGGGPDGSGLGRDGARAGAGAVIATPTQKAQILQLLREQGEAGVTPALALSEVGCMRLAARIDEIKSDLDWRYEIVNLGWTTATGNVLLGTSCGAASREAQTLWSGAERATDRGRKRLAAAIRELLPYMPLDVGGRRRLHRRHRSRGHRRRALQRAVADRVG